MPSLNVTRELYAGLTQFSERSVVPDLAESWDVEQGGLVWTFHLRKNLRWSDDRKLTAGDLRRSWLRALAPRTAAPLAGPDLGIVLGARSFHATGRGDVGIEAPDDRTLRVTLQHPIPWLDQLVAYPIASAYRPNAFSGPFRLKSRGDPLALDRNFNYWNVRAVKPSRLVMTTETKGADAILPRGLAPPGLPWVQTAKPPSGPGWTRLPTLSVQLLWFVTNRPPVANALDRAAIGHAVGDASLNDLVPLAMPGHDVVTSKALVARGSLRREPLTLAYTAQDARGRATAQAIAMKLAVRGVTMQVSEVPTLHTLVGAPAESSDLVLLGWSSKILDEYNILDLFPCQSAFNVAHWCDHSYDALMRRAVRTLDPPKRYAIERQLLGEKLRPGIPAVPLAQPPEYVWLRPGVRGFSWSPVGLYALWGMTRS